MKIKRDTKKEYRNIKDFSLNSLADFIAEYTRDGKFKKDAWAFWDWLDRKCKPPQKSASNQ